MVRSTKKYQKVTSKIHLSLRIANVIMTLSKMPFSRECGVASKLAFAIQKTGQLLEKKLQ